MLNSVQNNIDSLLLGNIKTWKKYVSEQPLLRGKEERLQNSTFRALPCIPQVLHADELVIPMEAVMLGLGVMVVQIFSQELQDDKEICSHGRLCFC